MLKGELIDGVRVNSGLPCHARQHRAVGEYVLDDIASRGHLKSLQREEKASTDRTARGAQHNLDMNTGRNYDLTWIRTRYSSVSFRRGAARGY